MKVFFAFKLMILTLLVIGGGLVLGSLISSQWLNAAPDNVQLGNYQEYFPNEQTELILLGTSWCPVCAKAREFLAEQNIAYLEYDVDQSEEGKALAKALAQIDVVPVIILRDRLLRGFNPRDLTELLRSASNQALLPEVVQAVSQ